MANSLENSKNSKYFKMAELTFVYLFNGFMPDIFFLKVAIEQILKIIIAQSSAGLYKMLFLPGALESK